MATCCRVDVWTDILGAASNNTLPVFDQDRGEARNHPSWADACSAHRRPHPSPSCLRPGIHEFTAQTFVEDRVSRS